MKLIVGIKQYRSINLALPKKIVFDEVDIMHKETTEFIELLRRNGFDEIFNTVEFLSDEFFKLLELAGDKYSLKFDFYFKYSKNELNNFKAFQLDVTSSIAMKNDIAYLSQERYDKLSTKCAIRGKVKWNQSKFMVIAQSIYTVPKDVYELLIESDLTGYMTNQVYNISHKQLEDAYCLCATSSMPERIEDKLNRSSQNGLSVYKKNILDGIEDFNFIADAKNEDDCESDIIVSKRAKDFFLANKFKRILLSPVLEHGTEGFHEYNELVKEFSKTILKFNKKHIIGDLGEKINPADLIEGVI